MGCALTDERASRQVAESNLKRENRYAGRDFCDRDDLDVDARDKLSQGSPQNKCDRTVNDQDDRQPGCKGRPERQISPPSLSPGPGLEIRNNSSRASEGTPSDHAEYSGDVYGAARKRPRRKRRGPGRGTFLSCSVAIKEVCQVTAAEGLL